MSYNNNQEYAELKNQNNSFKFISWFQDWRREMRGNRFREKNSDKDEEYKTKDQS